MRTLRKWLTLRIRSRLRAAARRKRQRVRVTPQPCALSWTRPPPKRIRKPSSGDVAQLEEAHFVRETQELESATQRSHVSGASAAGPTPPAASVREPLQLKPTALRTRSGLGSSRDTGSSHVLRHPPSARGASVVRFIEFVPFHLSPAAAVSPPASCPVWAALEEAGGRTDPLSRCASSDYRDLSDSVHGMPRGSLDGGSLQRELDAARPPTPPPPTGGEAHLCATESPFCGSQPIDRTHPSGLH